MNQRHETLIVNDSQGNFLERRKRADDKNVNKIRKLIIGTKRKAFGAF